MVLAAAGGVDHDKLVDFATKFYGTETTPKSLSLPKPFPCRYTGSDVSLVP